MTGSLAVVWAPDCDQTATKLTATPNQTATTCNHDRDSGCIPADQRHS